MEYCVDTNFITDEITDVFCGINASLFNWNETGLCTGHSTMVDGITSLKSPLFKKGRILLHLQVRSVCVVILSSLQNPEVLGSNRTQHLALHYHGQALLDSTVIPPVIYTPVALA